MSYAEALGRVAENQIAHIRKRCKDPSVPFFGTRSIAQDRYTAHRTFAIQAAHLEESSRGLIYLAAQLKVNLDNHLKKQKG